MLCTKCGNWVHDRCARIKRVTLTKLTTHFACLRCKVMMEGMVNLIE